MIQLDVAEAFASGTFRHCFYHPDTPDRCIKVDKQVWRKGATAKEIRFLERPVIARRLAHGVPMAAYHGHCETNLGVGAIFSIIRDGDGSISETLFSAIKRGLSEQEVEQLSPALERFKSRFLETGIICRDLRPWNICIQKTNGQPPEMILIDGFGHRYFPPFYDYIPALARFKIKQHFERFGFSDLETTIKIYAEQEYPPLNR